MSSGFRVLHLVRPFLGFLPEVKAADRKIPFRERRLHVRGALRLLGVLAVASVRDQHVERSGSSSPGRVIMASNRGTCMELIISPIVTSGIQLFVGSKIIEVDEREGGQSAFERGAKVARSFDHHR